MIVFNLPILDLSISSYSRVTAETELKTSHIQDSKASPNVVQSQSIRDTSEKEFMIIKETRIEDNTKKELQRKTLGNIIFKNL